MDTLEILYNIILNRKKQVKKESFINNKCNNLQGPYTIARRLQKLLIVKGEFTSRYDCSYIKK